MSSPALAARYAVPASEVVTALRRIENAAGMPGAGAASAFAPASAGPAYLGRPATDTSERLLDRARELSLDSVIRDIADLRVSIRHAFVAASPEYQLLIELSENGLRDCAKCVRELEARAAQHPYNKMLTKIDAAYDTAVRATRSDFKA